MIRQTAVDGGVTGTFDKTVIYRKLRAEIPGSSLSPVIKYVGGRIKTCLSVSDSPGISSRNAGTGRCKCTNTEILSDSNYVRQQPVSPRVQARLAV